MLSGIWLGLDNSSFKAKEQSKVVSCPWLQACPSGPCEGSDVGTCEPFPSQGVRAPEEVGAVGAPREVVGGVHGEQVVVLPALPPCRPPQLLHLVRSVTRDRSCYQLRTSASIVPDRHCRGGIIIIRHAARRLATHGGGYAVGPRIIQQRLQRPPLELCRLRRPAPARRRITVVRLRGAVITHGCQLPALLVVRLLLLAWPSMRQRPLRLGAQHLVLLRLLGLRPTPMQPWRRAQ